MDSVSDKKFKTIVRKLKKLIKESTDETEFHWLEAKLFNSFSAKQICDFLKIFKQANFELAILKIKEKNDIDVYNYFLDLAKFYDSNTDAESLENVLELQDEIEKTKSMGYINTFSFLIKNKNTEKIQNAVIDCQKLQANPTLLAVFVFFCKEADEEFIKKEALKIYSKQEMHQFLEKLNKFKAANKHKNKNNEIN